MGKKVTTALKNPFIWFLLAAGVRLLFVYPQYSGDTHTLVAWGQAIFQNPFHIFERSFEGIGAPNYPPIILYLLAISWKLFDLSLQLVNFLHFQLDIFPGRIVMLFTNFNMQAAFIKLFPILADLGIGFAIYKWQEKSKYALVYTLMYLFNPAVIYISAVWGQIESITLFLLLLSLLLSQKKGQKDQVLSQIIFMLAVLTKQTALWVLPIYLIIWLKESKLKTFLIGFVAQTTLFFVSFLPFGYTPWQSIQVFFSTLSGSSNFVADSAWNIWFWVYQGAKISDGTIFGLLSVRLYSIIFLGIIYLAICFWLIKRYSKNNIAWSLFLIALADFFIQTRVHERHLAPALVFFLLITLRKQIWFYLMFIVLSTYHLGNLLWSLRLPFI